MASRRTTRSGYVWVGTSGFSYPAWVGEFYPPQLDRSEWLHYYSEHFRAVEIDSTFYRLPAASVVERWARSVDREFRIAVKAGRYVTHVRRLTDTAEDLARFFDRIALLGDHLACVLWQLPPRMTADVDRLKRFLGDLSEIERAVELRHVFEFRHESWFEESVYRVLDDVGAAVVIADAPFEVLGPGMPSGRLGLPVTRARHTADFVYLRRHGPGGESPDGYPKHMVEEDADWIRQNVRQRRDVFVFYKKEVTGASRGSVHGLHDAMRLRDLLGPGR